MSLVEDEIKFVEELAFNGLCSSTIEFDSRYIGRILTSSRLLNGHLVHMSFLRASDNSCDPAERTYHFMHYTYQECFAAKCWVRHRTAGAALPVWHTGSSSSRSVGPAGPMTADTFLCREKYNERYNIFWRFVEVLDMVMILSKISIDERIRMNALQILSQHCNDISRSIWQTLCELDKSKRLEAIAAFNRATVLGLSACGVLIRLLQDEDRNVRLRAASALGRQRVLPDFVIEMLINLLQHEKQDVRSRAACIIHQQKKLPESIFDTLLSLFPLSPRGRLDVARALRGHDKLYPLLLRMQPSHLQGLLLIWLLQSFNSSSSICIWEHMLYIELDGKRWTGPLEEKETFRGAWVKGLMTVGSPCDDA